jgi:hypothetical protein
VGHPDLAAAAHARAERSAAQRDRSQHRAGNRGSPAAARSHRAAGTPADHPGRAAEHARRGRAGLPQRARSAAHTPARGHNRLSRHNRPAGRFGDRTRCGGTLREQIDALYREIDAIEPPPGLAPAHNRYLAGLEIERQALDDMLEFYSSLAIQSANRATLRMADSAHQIELARQLLDTRRAVVPATSIPAQTLR